MGALLATPAPPAGDTAPAQSSFFATASRMILQVLFMQTVISYFGWGRRSAVDLATKEPLPTFHNFLAPNQKFDVFFHLSNDGGMRGWEDLNDNCELVGLVLEEEYKTDFFKKDKKIDINFTPKNDYFFSPFELPQTPALFLISTLVPHSQYVKATAGEISSEEEWIGAISGGHGTAMQRILRDLVLPGGLPQASLSLVTMMEPFSEVELLSLVDADPLAVPRKWVVNTPKSGEKESENAQNSEKNKTNEKNLEKNLEQNEKKNENSENKNELRLLDANVPRDIYEVSEEEKLPVRHFKSRIDLNIVYDIENKTINDLNSDPYGTPYAVVTDKDIYFPKLLLTDLWMVEKNFLHLSKVQNHQNPIPLSLHFNVVSPFYYKTINHLHQAVENNKAMQFQTRKEGFMLKRIILETNPFMLVFSAAFILLHSVFSFFAFKNEVQFWHQNESMQGLSALSVVITLICEVIVGLYLLESQTTSWLILFEIAMGILISGWKVTKAVKITFSKAFPYIHFSDAKNYGNTSTKAYDQIAIKYMSMLLFPCVLVYAMYSLFHYQYRSWYSFVISVLAGAVYTFGFIMMTPQLYINYKLKSVDHLPWKALIYKSMNTFVDDVASFLVDMPWMHRLSCFRDDIIFFAYLYQRWIYTEDRNRQSEWAGAPAPGDVGQVEGGRSAEESPRIEEILNDEVSEKQEEDSTEENAEEEKEEEINEKKQEKIEKKEDEFQEKKKEKTEEKKQEKNTDNNDQHIPQTENIQDQPQQSNTQPRLRKKKINSFA